MKQPPSLLLVSLVALLEPIAHGEEVPNARRPGTTTNNVVMELPAVVVRSTPVSKYRAASVDTATFTGASPEQLPLVVDVLTTDFIQETAPLDIHDLLRYPPGIYTGGKTLQSRTAGQYTIRGMSGSEVTSGGTLPLPGFMGTFLDPTVLERIEIVKGPVGSTTGGAGSSLGAYGAGGSVNLILKEARLDQPFQRVGFRSMLGEDIQRYRVSFDRNEPLAEENVALRLPGNFEYGKPYWLPKGHDWRQSWSLAPSILWRVNNRLRMGLNTTIQYTDQPGYQGIPIFRGKPWGEYDWDSYIPGDNDMRDRYLGYTTQGWMDWNMTHSVLFRTGLGLAHADIESEHLGSSAYANPRTTLPYSYSYYDIEMENWNVYERMIAEYDTAGIRHTTVAQADYLEKSTDRIGSFGDVASTDVDRSLFQDVISDTSVHRYGGFVQDTLQWRWFRLLAGLRWDRHESQLGNEGDALSPRVGLSFLPTGNIVLFGNVSKTESPNFGYMKSETEELTSSWGARQYETGIRYAPREALWMSLSGYRIEQENTPSYNDRTSYYEEEGRSESRGVEFSVNGDISKDWSVYAAYSYIDYEMEGEKVDFDRFPPHAVTLSTSYRLTSGPLDDVVLGMAYRYRAGYDATFRGQYVGEGYSFRENHVVDCSISSSLKSFGGPKNWTLTLGVKNLFNEKYVESNRHYYQAFPGDPRIFEVAIHGAF